MTRVLINGMSGVGKSSLLQELSRRGFRTVDTDYGDYHESVEGEWLWRDETLGYLETVEPLLRQAATLEVVTTIPVGQIADIVVAHCL